MSPGSANYGASDPRAKLKTAHDIGGHDPAGVADFAVLSAGGADESIVRGQNFVLQHVSVIKGSVLRRVDQEDEYVLLIPDSGLRVRVTANEETSVVDRPSVVVIPPGDSQVVAESAGRLVRLLTVVSAPELATESLNSRTYAAPMPNVAPFTAWPDAPDGPAIRVYDLDVPKQPGRFGRIWRCSTFMVNFLDPQEGPRDARELSPHIHSDFEQCSLALQGEFTHHLRWSWGPDSTQWRDDVHIVAPSPSAVVIPPPVIHTTEATGSSLNQLVDIFCPPRRDFSEVSGWVLNEADYPMTD